MFLSNGDKLLTKINNTDVSTAFSLRFLRSNRMGEPTTITCIAERATSFQWNITAESVGLNLSVPVTANSMNMATIGIQFSSSVLTTANSTTLLDFQSTVVFEDSSLPRDTIFECLASNGFSQSRQTINLALTETSCMLIIMITLLAI